MFTNTDPAKVSHRLPAPGYVDVWRNEMRQMLAHRRKLKGGT